MRTWEDYKNHVKATSAQDCENMRQIEEIASIVSTIISRRRALGISQRDLAKKCGMPQSSVARIETLQIIPKLDTLLKIIQALNLKLQISKAV